MALQPGTYVGPYEIAGILGAGGMGEVYGAPYRRLNRDVAPKVLPEAFAADAERLRRFENEARATGTLNHPNILAIHDVGIHGGQPYLVEELLEGVTLRELLADGLLPPTFLPSGACRSSGTRKPGRVYAPTPPRPARVTLLAA